MPWNYTFLYGTSNPLAILRNSDTFPYVPITLRLPFQRICHPCNSIAHPRSEPTNLPKSVISLRKVFSDTPIWMYVGRYVCRYVHAYLRMYWYAWYVHVYLCILISAGHAWPPAPERAQLTDHTIWEGGPTCDPAPYTLACIPIHPCSTQSWWHKS